MTKDEYTRLKGLLDAVGEMQRIVAGNMLNARKRFALTEKALADLLTTIAKRGRNR